MTDSAHNDASGGGDGKKTGSKLGAVAIVILVIVVAFSGVIPVLVAQIGGFFQMVMRNMGPILGIVAIAALFGAFRKKKPPE